MLTSALDHYRIISTKLALSLKTTVHLNTYTRQLFQALSNRHGTVCGPQDMGSTLDEGVSSCPYALLLQHKEVELKRNNDIAELKKQRSECQAPEVPGIFWIGQWVRWTCALGDP
jgi:hypothetical protein